LRLTLKVDSPLNLLELSAPSTIGRLRRILAVRIHQDFANQRCYTTGLGFGSTSHRVSVVALAEAEVWHVTRHQEEAESAGAVADGQGKGQMGCGEAHLHITKRLHRNPCKMLLFGKNWNYATFFVSGALYALAC
jgi:hypothetical protein